MLANTPHLIFHNKENHFAKAKSEVTFGPNLSSSKPIQMKQQIKKLVHYDCNDDIDAECGDIPEEDEVYIKENLLNKKRDETNTEHDDDLSMININVSKLLSSSGSNSKNSTSKEAFSLSKLSKHSNPSATTINKQFHTNPNSSIMSKRGAVSSSGGNSIELSKDKKHITAKRKNIYDKLMKKNNNNINNSNSNSNCNSNNQYQHNTKNNNEDSGIIDENELKDIVNDYDFNLNENKSTNVKITNITNIILNVKNIAPKSFKSFDIHRQSEKDIMMRDMKSLHLITQRALNAVNNPKTNSVDSFDDERRSFLNFRRSNNVNEELYIDDNTQSDPNMNATDNNNHNNTNTNNKQIINIININTTPRTSANKRCDSYRTTKTKLKVPVSVNNRNNDEKSVSSVVGKIAVKDFINSIKGNNVSNAKKNKREKFVAIGKLKK